MLTRSCLLLLLLPVSSGAQDAAAVKFFEQKVRPLLANHCYKCHGADKQQGKLRLDSLDAMKKGGDLGPALLPGKPDDSLLLKAVRYKDDLKMPPRGKLSDADVVTLTAWVTMGSPWPGANPGVATSGSAGFTVEQKNFWAFKPPLAVQPPAVRDASWPLNPLDRFILVRLEAKGLEPAPPADRRTLLRRMTFDLTGLPPTPEEMETFLADTKPAAVERAIDRLLASPAYGERWGRRWLDVARYADSNGMDENLAHGNAWRYRDYVVAAFNRDKPFRDFVREQLAGDLLAPADSDGLIATGFLSLGPKMLAEDDPVKMQMDIIDEQIDAVGQAFLGLTLGCARCHDHKFDPIPTADYYSLAGIFKSTRTMDNFGVVARWHERPLTTPEGAQRLAQLEQRLVAKKAEIIRLETDARQRLQDEARRQLARYVEAAEELLRQPPFPSMLSDPKRVPSAGVLLREAEEFQRGNVMKDFTGYGEKIGVIYNAGPLPNFAEYDMTVATAGSYQLEIRYAAAEARPITVSVNGKLVLDSAAGGVTGSWYPNTQTWEVAGVIALRAGKNVLRLERKEPFPHIDKFALVPLPASFRTPDQLAGERELTPLFLRQWFAHRQKQGKPFSAAELKKLASDPQGPFALPPMIDPHVPAETLKELKRLRGELAALEKSRPMLPSAMAVSENKTENVRVHIRGNHLTLGPETPRRFPRILAGETQPALGATQSGRRELAEWLTRDDHPLTARVLVNRLWLGHFGEGLVRTPDNFGRLGDRPAHPELLDWLAVEFVKSGWSIKAMHRLILTSNTYGMSTKFNESAARLDPDNRLHWRFNRQRLEVEALRDAILSVSGRLDRTMTGSLLTSANRSYVTSTANRSYEGYDHPRRSIYLPVIRSDLFDLFQAFDFADPSTLMGKRATTTVAPQALFMMNGKLMQEETRRLADDLLKLTPLDDAGRLSLLYARAYGRLPDETESRRAVDFLRRYQAALEEPKTPDARLGAWQALCRVVLSSNEFVYVE